MLEEINSRTQIYALQFLRICHAVGDCIVHLWNDEDGYVAPQAINRCNPRVEALQYLV